MSGFTRLVHSDFVTEYHRLLAAQSAARAAKDPEAIDAADADLALFLRYNAAGRLPEYFASRQERE